ncbi:MAG: DUF1501 domain-containing protein [Verrucomicrobiaceae bacterium]|nr:DUF1501 domain-containing protein [Verrucomicrobiaceae bacterium]
MITWDSLQEDNHNGLKRPSLAARWSRLTPLCSDDLEERGLLESTLVVWMGEFGRTPKINNDAGRDHRPGCHSVLLAGGGGARQRVIGSNMPLGTIPMNAPSPLRHPRQHLRSPRLRLPRDRIPITDGRPVPLTDGVMIPELF